MADTPEPQDDRDSTDPTTPGREGVSAPEPAEGGDDVTPPAEGSPRS